MSTRVLNNVAVIKVPNEDKTLIKFQMDADNVWSPGVSFQNMTLQGVVYNSLVCYVK